MDISHNVEFGKYLLVNKLHAYPVTNMVSIVWYVSIIYFKSFHIHRHNHNNHYIWIWICVYIYICKIRLFFSYFPDQIIRLSVVNFFFFYYISYSNKREDWEHWIELNLLNVPSFSFKFSITDYSCFIILFYWVRNYHYIAIIIIINSIMMMMMIIILKWAEKKDSLTNITHWTGFISHSIIIIIIVVVFITHTQPRWSVKTFDP